MNPNVCYLVPTSGGGLVFPTELPEYEYSLGAFYLFGTPRNKLLDNFTFHAVHNDKVLSTDLQRYRDSKSFYEVSVADVGRG